MKTHRIERLTNKMADAIQKRIDRNARAYMGGATNPPFTTPLSDQEQLEMYFAMDSQKWQTMIEKHGIKGAVDYSQAMLKLLDKHGIHPQMTPLLAQEASLATGGQPGLEPQRAAPDWKQVVEQALSGAGLDPLALMEEIDA
ncbi:MAG: hypothetical protein AB7Q01_08690 [Gammaproteobacteria bacterium]